MISICISSSSICTILLTITKISWVLKICPNPDCSDQPTPKHAFSGGGEWITSPQFTKYHITSTTTKSDESKSPQRDDSNLPFKAELLGSRTGNACLRRFVRCTAVFIVPPSRKHHSFIECPAVRTCDSVWIDPPPTRRRVVLLSSHKSYCFLFFFGKVCSMFLRRVVHRFDSNVCIYISHMAIRNRAHVLDNLLVIGLVVINSTIKHIQWNVHKYLNESMLSWWSFHSMHYDPYQIIDDRLNVLINQWSASLR